MDEREPYVPEGRPYKYCNVCGAKIDQEAEICPKCGVRQPFAGAGQNFGQQAVGGISYKVVPPPTQSDMYAIQKTEMGSILGIIGILLPMIMVVLLYSQMAFLNPFVKTTSTTTTTLSKLTPASLLSSLGLYIGLTVVGYILGIVSLVFYRSSFGELMDVDRRSFKSPHGLVKYFYIGLALLVVSYIILITGFIAALAASSSAYAPSASNLLDKLGIVLILFAIIAIVAAILLIIGIIGLIIGIWREGERYNNTLLKVGAILFIIPFADIVAPILIFLGTQSVKKELNSGGKTTV
jgi:hypothetical protein